MYVTLWYAGLVAMTLGYENMTLTECKTLSNIVINDIQSAYVEMKTETINGLHKNKWSVTCEGKPLEIQLKDIKE